MRTTLFLIAGLVLAAGASCSPAAAAGRDAVPAAVPAPFRAVPAGGDSARDERRARMRERIEQMPPAQKEEALRRFQDMQDRRQELRQELESLPPDQRAQRIEQLRQEMETKKTERRERFQETFQSRWENASDEERDAFCRNARDRCGAEGNYQACAFVQQACGG